MPPENKLLRTLHQIALEMPPVIDAYRSLRDFSKRDPLMAAGYKKLFERKRLTLPTMDAEKLAPEPGSIEFPVYHPLFAGEDAPLADMLFLLSMAKGRKAKRILEVGTYRARTTLALHLNCPAAQIVSYDIQVLPSRYRASVEGKPGIELRHASFGASADILLKETPYDLIFVDGSHRFEHVLEDSDLALKIIAPGGLIIWHDYRYNDHFNDELRVPEALTLVSRKIAVHAVPGTMCAVHVRDATPSPAPQH